MLRYEELQQLSEDRSRLFRAEADAERRVRPAPRLVGRRRQRQVLAAFELLLRPRRAT